MIFQELQSHFRDFLVFSPYDIKKVEPNFDRRRLNEWQNRGYIKKLRRGYYMFSNTSLNEEALFLIANRLYTPSYVSLEMALSYYNLIPEGVYSITSVSTNKTNKFDASIGTFSYRKVRPNLFFGYAIGKYKEQGYKIAEPEKAVLDFLYLNPNIASEADFFEWRFNGQEFFAKADMKKLRAYAEAFKEKRLVVRLEQFIEFLQHAHPSTN